MLSSFHTIDFVNFIISISAPQIGVRKRFFFYFSTKTYVVDTQTNRLDMTVLLSIKTHVSRK